MIMSTTDYIKEGYRQLSDTNFYTKLRQDPTLDISKKICQVLTEMRSLKLITEKNFEFLNKSNPKAGRFYLLLKIHKNIFQVDQYAVLLDTQLATSAILWNAHIRDYVPKTASYVRDTH